MGSSARLDFIEQVMTEHGEELALETWKDLPAAVKALKPRVELEAEIDEIARLSCSRGLPASRSTLPSLRFPSPTCTSATATPRKTPSGDAENGTAAMGPAARVSH